MIISTQAHQPQPPWRRPAILGLCVLPALFASNILADTPGPATIPILTLDQTAPPVEPAPNATGDWGGLRTKLADKGLTFAGLVQLDISKNFTGGINTTSTPIRYLLDLNLTLDTQKAFAWPGGTFFFDFESHDGPNASSESVGDIQGFDPIDGVHFVQIYQLWYQQRVLNDQIRAKIGKIDANADFSVIEHGKEFFNSSLAYSTTIFPMVTYPDPAPGFELFYEPDPIFYAGAGVYYSNSHQTFLNLAGHPQSIERTDGGVFAIGEIGSRWTLFKSLPGHAALGMWGHTGEFPQLDPPPPPVGATANTTNGTLGAYSFLDQSFYHQETENQPVRDLGGFIQYGWTRPDVSPIAQQFGAGLAATGLVPARPRDILGLGTTWAHLGDQPKLHADELALETFYKLYITPYAILKPDLQYISHPSGLYSDALVFTLRVEIDF